MHTVSGTSLRSEVEKLVDEIDEGKYFTQQLLHSPMFLLTDRQR